MKGQRTIHCWSKTKLSKDSIDWDEGLLTTYRIETTLACFIADPAASMSSGVTPGRALAAAWLECDIASTNAGMVSVARPALIAAALRYLSKAGSSLAVNTAACSVKVSQLLSMVANVK